MIDDLKNSNAFFMEVLLFFLYVCGEFLSAMKDKTIFIKLERSVRLYISSLLSMFLTPNHTRVYSWGFILVAFVFLGILILILNIRLS
jgi:hypothetical protein